eukprot:scaffold3323_cov279-Pinguiococcus_pyrenoidosus.AAC.6
MLDLTLSDCDRAGHRPSDPMSPFRTEPAAPSWPAWALPLRLLQSSDVRPLPVVFVIVQSVGEEGASLLSTARIRPISRPSIVACCVIVACARLTATVAQLTSVPIPLPTLRSRGFPVSFRGARRSRRGLYSPRHRAPFQLRRRGAHKARELRSLAQQHSEVAGCV